MTPDRLAEIRALLDPAAPTHVQAGTARVSVYCPDALRQALADLLAEREFLAAERDALKAAIVKHHDQRADDRCFLDDADLYAAAGLEPADVRVGDKDAMLANCARFLAQRCESGGPWKSYADLLAERDELRAALQPFAALAPALPSDARDSEMLFHAMEETDWSDLRKLTVDACRRAAALLARRRALLALRRA